MSTIEDKYPYNTINEALTEKDWAAGSSKQVESTEFLIRKASNSQPTSSGKYVGVHVPVTFPPALWKLCDEVIVNALDHHIRCSTGPTPVTSIAISLSKEGEISVMNDGPGVDIALHNVASQRLGRPTYVPTLIFGSVFQGSNRNQAEDSIIGGVNGLGGKLANVFSTRFTVETVSNGMYFSQTWSNRMEMANPPVVGTVDSMRNILPSSRLLPHTTVSFIPDYINQFKYTSYDEPLHITMCDLIRTRAFFASAYANYTSKTHAVAVRFNDELIPVRNMADVAAILFPSCDRYRCEITPSTGDLATYKYPWEVVAVVTGASSYDPPAMGTVNGIIVRYGNHYKHIMNELVAGVTITMAKAFKDKNLKFSRSQVENNVLLMLNTKIPKPAWTGQRKDMLTVDIRKLAGYTIDKAFVASITNRLRDHIMDSILGDIQVATGRKKQKAVQYEQYIPAIRCGTKHSQQCSLIVCEGLSALSQVATGIANTVGWDYYGVIALGGVIINVRRNCEVIETDIGRYVKKTTAKLTNNEFMKVLTDVTGLNAAYKYDPASPSYAKEIAELHYGSLIACVDQDLDGKGCILGLLLSTFEIFWPRLLNAGYCKWFCTPIVRAYPRAGGKIMEFYSTQEFDRWSASVDIARYEVRYYKGIASHERSETLHMFKVLRDNLHTYYCDDRSRERFNTYFGKDSDLRKAELSRPIIDRDPAAILQQETHHKISCSEHLEYETFLYQKDNLERKLNHVVDGQNQAGRKVLDGILAALKKPGKSLKVAQIAGYISEKKAYHHGEACLMDSIAGKAFITTGGKQLPLLLPLSQFGSRLGGGSDVGQPRYIYAKLNKRITDLLFPQDDYWLLPFNYEDGKRAEPKFFVPIIPLVIAESTSLPAHGWSLVVWARDIGAILSNVRRMILLSDDCVLSRMPPCIYKGAPYEWKGRFATIRGNLYSFGSYTYSAKTNTLCITELPLRVWTNNYVKDMKKKAASDARIIASLHNSSDDLHVNITIKLRPDAMSLLAGMNDSVYTDGVEEYFQLRSRMFSNINLMGVRGEVLSYTDYESAMYTWFTVRKEYYEKRIIRARIIMVLTIRKLENIIRYIEECNSYGLSKQKKAAMEAILAQHTYDKIDVGMLNAPKYTLTVDLERLILGGPGANYDYLLKLSDLKKSAEALVDRRAALEVAREELIAHDNTVGRGRFPGAAIWESELDALEANIKEGHRTFWKYDEVAKYKFE